MPDIRLVQDGRFPFATEVSVDWLLQADGTLDDSQALATAVIVALGTDRLAAPSDILPDPDSTDRRGWWGDLDAEEIWNGWPIGCRLWLLKRSKIVGPEAFEGSTLMRVEQYINEALQPFLDLRIASRMQVDVARVDTQRIQALIKMYRGPSLAVELRYQILWADIVTKDPDAPAYSGNWPFT
jgi:phage gp46-like protein